MQTGAESLIQDSGTSSPEFGNHSSVHILQQFSCIYIEFELLNICLKLIVEKNADQNIGAVDLCMWILGFWTSKLCPDNLLTKALCTVIILLVLLKLLK